MTWKHDGHDVEVMEPESDEPGSLYGPYCHTCDEDMRFFVVPSEEDIKKAQAWWERNKERLQRYAELHPES